MSTTSEPSAPPPEPEPSPVAPSETGADLTAELAKWKELARKNEAKAKANAQAVTELEKLKAAQMTDTDRAVQTARAEATVEARKSLGSRLVAAEVRVAAAGRPVDVDTLLEGIDASKFLDDDGEPKATEIRDWIDKVAPAAATPQEPGRAPFPDLGQGARGVGTGATPTQEFANFIKGQLGT